MKLYSVVIPVFNSCNLIAQNVERIRAQFISLRLPFEIILINDGSGDNSWEIISGLAREYSEIIAINFLRNYGQHNANLCGFRESKGEYVITMDDDLQNPPEEIPKLISAIQNGHDLVMGQFENKRHPFYRRVGSKFIGWLNRKIFDVPEQLTLSNFRIIHRDVVDRVCRDTAIDPYIPGLLLKYSHSRANVAILHMPRTEGKSNYTLRKIIRLVAAILFMHSAYPLRISASIGFVVAGLSFIMSLYFLFNSLYFGKSLPGWTSLAVLMSFFSGFLILLISIIGEYVIRILRELGNSGSYQIKQVVRK